MWNVVVRATSGNKSNGMVYTQKYNSKCEKNRTKGEYRMANWSPTKVVQKMSFIKKMMLW